MPNVTYEGTCKDFLKPCFFVRDETQKYQGQIEMKSESFLIFEGYINTYPPENF